MRTSHLCLLMLFSTVALAPNAQAHVRDKSWEFGALIQNVDVDEHFDLDNSIGTELQFGHNFTSRVGAQALIGFTSTKLGERDDDFIRAVLAITGNFLAEGEARTIPFMMAGLGVIQETRAAFTDRSGVTPVHVAESFDSSALLTIGIGARTFISDNWAIRYEGRYNHHDSFEETQDEWVLGAGVTWIVGGQK